jgi:hypothetical protein
MLGEASYFHAHCDLRDAIMSGRHESNTVPVGTAQEKGLFDTLVGMTSSRYPLCGATCSGAEWWFSFTTEPTASYLVLFLATTNRQNVIETQSAATWYRGYS